MTDTWAARVLRRTRLTAAVHAGEEATVGKGREGGSRLEGEWGPGECLPAQSKQNLMEKIIEMKVRAY